MAYWTIEIKRFSKSKNFASIDELKVSDFKKKKTLLYEGKEKIKQMLIYEDWKDYIFEQRLTNEEIKKLKNSIGSSMLVSPMLLKGKIYKWTADTKDKIIVQIKDLMTFVGFKEQSKNSGVKKEAKLDLEEQAPKIKDIFKGETKKEKLMNEASRYLFKEHKDDKKWEKAVLELLKNYKEDRDVYNMMFSFFVFFSGSSGLRQKEYFQKRLSKLKESSNEQIENLSNMAKSVLADVNTEKLETMVKNNLKTVAFNEISEGALKNEKEVKKLLEETEKFYTILYPNLVEFQWTERKIKDLPKDADSHYMKFLYTRIQELKSFIPKYFGIQRKIRKIMEEYESEKKLIKKIMDSKPPRKIPNEIEKKIENFIEGV